MSTQKSNTLASGDQPTAKSKGTTISSLSDVQDILHNILYKNTSPTVNMVFEQMEQRIPLKREQVAYVILGVLTLYLIFGAFAELLCNFIGFAYPAYASVKAIRTSNKDDDTHWLIYWTTFAAFTVVDFFAEIVFRYFPFYWLIKVFFMLYLYLPQTYGALVIYERFVDPAISKIDNYLSGYMNKVEKKE